MIRNPALKYFLKNGLKDIDDLPQKTIDLMRLSLGLNWGDESGFVKSMANSGVSKERLTSIFRKESEVANREGMATAGDTTARSEDKIFTRGEIAQMSTAEYAAARDKILEQYSSGQIK